MRTILWGLALLLPLSLVVGCSKPAEGPVPKAATPAAGKKGGDTKPAVYTY